MGRPRKNREAHEFKGIGCEAEGVCVKVNGATEKGEVP